MKFRNGYNPSHIDGLGDLLESVAQTFGRPITNYDRDTILMQIYPEVTTQKILLVGHSQGTFYTNEMYDYLIAHGVSPQSIAVYNLATPADHVGGGGTYLTSTNDKAIECVRELDAEAGTAQPLPANTIVPHEPGWQMDEWGGHSFSNAYLRGAPDRIVSDIKKTLSKLSAGTSSTPNCFVPPSQTLGYKTQSAVFAFTDPASRVVVPAVTTTASAVAAVASDTYGGLSEVTNALNTAIGKTFYTFFPKPNAQNATAAFAVEKALYGSSLTPEEYQVLLEDKPLPEPNSPAQSATQNQTVPQPTESPLDEMQTTPLQPENPAPENSAPETQPVQQPAAPPITGLIAIAVPPGLGAGNAPVSDSSSQPASEPVIADSSTSTTDTVASTTEPIATTTEPVASTTEPVSVLTPLAFAILSPDDNSSFSTTTVGFTGTTSPSAMVFASFGAASTSAQADTEGNWSFTLTLGTGTTTVAFSALDATGATSSTSTRTVAVSLPQTPAAPVLTPITQTQCTSNASLETEGYFFSPHKDEAGYSPQGYLEDHFALLPAYQTGRTFKLFWNFYSDTCGIEGSVYDHPSLWLSLPSGDTNWSVRFTSATHFDVWDDDSGQILVSEDIPVLPSYTSIEFGATVDANGSTLASRGLRISQNGSAPTIESSITAASNCMAESNSYLFDRTYERAEYVDGLLRLHLRLQTPYNDGRGFYYLVLGGSDCTALRGKWWKEIHTGAGLPAYERYFSLRMASSTHWQLWDDEQNASLGVEGDIPDNSAYVRFYGVLDVDASYLSGAYAPTQ